MIDYKSITEISEKLVRAYGEAFPPVDVEGIVKELGIKIKPANLTGEISGLLISKSDTHVIGVNKTDSHERKRFTIAHELGHYKLHYKKKEMFIDEDIVYTRGNISSKEEVEANAFAASLLMPEFMLKKQITAQNHRSLGEDQILNLAEAFEVSTIAMTYRLTNLGMI